MEYVAEDTKIVWIGSPPIFPFKPRDFCTVIHIRKLKDGTVVVLNRSVRGEGRGYDVLLWVVGCAVICAVYESVQWSFHIVSFLLYANAP